MSEYEQAVFISYAWGAERENIVNEIDETLQQRGIRIVRDKRALGYRGSIKEFMERIGQGRCVIVVISDKYLRSANCMFELVEIAENKQFHDRVFPVVLSDANIYDPLKRIEYVKYWEAKRKELAKAMKTLDPANLQGIRDDMDQYDRIRDQISGLTSILKDMNTLTPDVHRDSEFSNLYDAIVRRLEENATDVTSEFNDLTKKAEDERQTRKEVDRLAAEKAEVERIAQEKAEADRLAIQKANDEHKAKEEADLLALRKAEAEHMALERAEAERLAQIKAETELKAQEEAGRLAAQKSAEEQEAKEKSYQPDTLPVDIRAAPPAVASLQKKPFPWVPVFGVGMLAIVGIILALLSSRNRGTPTVEAPAAIEPTSAVAIGGNGNGATENPALSNSATEAPVIANTGSTPDCAQPDIFCVGLVTDVGKVYDGGFNQYALEGLERSQADGVADVINYIESSDPNDYAKHIAFFADENYDVIVTVGFLLADATVSAASSYPDIKFIGIDQFQTSDTKGVVGLNFPEDQGGFLVGALAAMMSKNHKIGAVCGTDSVPPVWRYGEGYRAGAAYADNAHGITTDVLVAYHNEVGFDKTFTDPDWGAETAHSMMDEGADVIFGCGGLTGNGAITAAAENGLYAVGIDTDQYYTLPDAASHMLSSAIKHIAPGVMDLLKMAKEGNFPTGNYMGQAGYAPFHDLENEVPDDLKTFMADLQQKLANGEVQTNVPPVKP